jgi:acyl-CoA thioesterase
MFDFTSETTVERAPEQPGRYRAKVSADWNAPVFPHGGVVTAAAVRAMTDALANADQPLRSVSAVFVSAVAPGPVEIDVDVLHRGRSVSQVRGALRSAGQGTGIEVTAVYGRTRPGFALSERAFPDVPPQEQCPPFRDVINGTPAAPLWKRIHARRARGHAPWDDYEPGSSEQAFWYRYDEPPVLASGQLDPLALIPMCDTMPGAVAERVGRASPLWIAPSTGLTVHILGAAWAEWLLGVIRLHRADDGYASAEAEIWDPQAGLVAFATQVMFFSFIEDMPGDRVNRIPGFGA